MGKPNLRLKGLIISKYGTQASAALDFEMNEFRLSRIIHRRAAPSPEERRMIAWKLQRPIVDLFPETQERVA
jgi:hypothetical protein